jgi:chitodextrinase
MNVNAGQTGVWTNVRIQNNVIVNCGTGALDLRGNTTSTASNNLLNLSSSTAASSFVSYTANAGTANNLSLSATATSLLDQGLSLSPLFTMDKAGKLRVGAWDIGAFEFAGGSTDTTAPSVPANLGGAAASTTQINLTWTASTDNIGVTGYSVYRNNALAGTTATTTYTDTGLTAATTYTYSLSAYDAAGNLSARSASVNVTTLTTELPPVITTQPQSLTTVASGASFTLSVIATGTGLTYQWKKDGNAISGATSATYTVASMSAGNAGAYTVVVTNSLGSVTSATANVSLTVAPSNAIISITVN